MSRVGNKIIALPEGTTLEVLDSEVVVKGKLGEQRVHLVGGITLVQDGASIKVSRPNDLKQSRALHGTTRANLANAITGVSTGFTRKLKLSGIGYRAAMRGEDLVLNVGYSHEVVITPDKDAKIFVDGTIDIRVEGPSKQAVGQTAARIREVRKPEPYNGKGILYAGEKIIRKEGKRAGKK